MQRQKRYRWTNVVVIVVSVYLLASSMWGTPELYENRPNTDVGDVRWLAVAYVLAGVCGVASIVVSLKSRGAGRALTALGGVVALSGLLAMRDATTTVLLSLGASGLALLVAAFFMGPMPTPEQERHPR